MRNNFRCFSKYGCKHAIAGGFSSQELFCVLSAFLCLWSQNIGSKVANVVSSWLVVCDDIHSTFVIGCLSNSKFLTCFPHDLTEVAYKRKVLNEFKKKNWNLIIYENKIKTKWHVLYKHIASCRAMSWNESLWIASS